MASVPSQGAPAAEGQSGSAFVGNAAALVRIAVAESDVRAVRAEEATALRHGPSVARGWQELRQGSAAGKAGSDAHGHCPP